MQTITINTQKELEEYVNENGVIYVDGNLQINFHMSTQYSIKAGGFIKAGWSIKAGRSIKAGGFIKAGVFIEAGGSIEAGRSIKAGGSIEAGGFIKAGEFIKAGGFIKAGESIKSGEYITAGRSIEAGDTYGISAGLHIYCEGKLKFGLKAFAGICTWKEITDAERTITCSKLEGGGVVGYGILNETGFETKTITADDGTQLEISRDNLEKQGFTIKDK